MLKLSLVSAALLAVCLGQQSQGSQQSGSEKQVRLEDIERDTLNSAQQRQQHQQVQQQQQHFGLTQQQLAAYQHQLLLQQLQQQYFAPQPITYPGYSAVPLMIIPGNQLGVGSPALPLQAYFLPDPSLIYQQPAFSATQQTPPSVYQVQAPQNLQARYRPVVPPNSVYRVPAQASQQQQSAQQSLSFSYSPQQQASAPGQGQQLLLQSQSVQPYNAYNAIYAQRQQKNLYSSGVKSTPAPPSLLKSQSQASSPITYSQPLTSEQGASSYLNYKSF